jgi:hypothetical protein
MQALMHVHDGRHSRKISWTHWHMHTCLQKLGEGKRMEGCKGRQESLADSECDEYAPSAVHLCAVSGNGIRQQAVAEGVHGLGTGEACAGACSPEVGGEGSGLKRQTSH